MNFVNSCNCLVDYEVLENAITEECARRNIVPNDSYKIYLYRGYAGISIKHNKVSVHRIIGKYMTGIDFGSNVCVHHLNQNKLDNRISNLQVIKNDLHSKGHKIVQFVDKANLTKNAKLATDKIKRKDVSAEDVTKLHKQGMTYKEIAKKLNCGYNTVWRRLKEIC